MIRRRGFQWSAVLRRVLATLVLLLGCIGSLSSAVAQEASAPDSAEAEASWFILPNVYYTPETSVAGGVAGGYFFRMAPGSRPSSVQGAVTVTARRQLLLSLRPEVFTARDRWHAAGEVFVQDYPDVFYGIGEGTPDALEEEFTARRINVLAMVERTMWRHLRLGLRYRFRVEQIADVAEDGLLATAEIPGRDESWLSGAGVTAVWDARDNLFYPRGGSYVEAYAIGHAAALGSTFGFGRFVIDARRYVPLVGRHLLALQGYGEAVAGTAPFTALPILGGTELMRGYREGRFRDDVLALVQSEYRFPIWWRIRGALFASVGDVASRVDAFQTSEVEVAAGAGLRIRISPEDLNIRIDYAIGREGGALYFTLQEAF